MHITAIVEGKEISKKEYLYSAILANTLKALRHGSHITPCLPFLCKHSPEGATLTEVADISLQLTTNLLTSKG